MSLLLLWILSQFSSTLHSFQKTQSIFLSTTQDQVLGSMLDLEWEVCRMEKACSAETTEMKSQHQHLYILPMRCQPTIFLSRASFCQTIIISLDLSTPTKPTTNEIQLQTNSSGLDMYLIQQNLLSHLLMSLM